MLVSLENFISYPIIAIINGKSDWYALFTVCMCTYVGARERIHIEIHTHSSELNVIGRQQDHASSIPTQQAKSTNEMNWKSFLFAIGSKWASAVKIIIRC